MRGLIYPDWTEKRFLQSWHSPAGLCQTVRNRAANFKHRQQELMTGTEDVQTWHLSMEMGGLTLDKAPFQHLIKTGILYWIQVQIGNFIVGFRTGWFKYVKVYLTWWYHVLCIHLKP